MSSPVTVVEIRSEKNANQPVTVVEFADGQYTGRRTQNNINNNLENLSAAIAEQDLAKYGYAIGDYFIGSSGYRYYLADMDTYYGGYNSYAVIATHHCGIVVDTRTNSVWGESGQSYHNSTLHTYLSGTVLENIKTDLTTLFGNWSNHLLSHQFIDNKIGGWGDSWVSGSYIEALSECQLYGSPIWSADGYQQGVANKPLELFQKFRYNQIFGNTYVWLKSLYSAAAACNAGDNGRANNGSVTSGNRAAGLIYFY